MKKLAVLIFSVMLITLFSSSVTVSAQNNGNNSKVMVLRRDEVFYGDYLAAGEKVEISGTVNGDVYVFGGQVYMNGIVNGDLIVAGGTVYISGKVLQNLRAAGGQITVTGDIGRNASLAGGNIELSQSSIIRRNLIVGAGKVTLDSQVLGDAKIGSGDLNLTGRIDGSLDAAGDSIRVSSKGKIGGNLTYWGRNEASIDPGAVIGGKITRNRAQTWFKPPNAPQVRGLSQFANKSRLFSFIITLILGVIIIKLFPNFIFKGIEIIGNRPLGSLGRGFLLFLLFPSLIILFTITIIGIPLAILLSFIYVFILYIARIISIFWLGIYISGKLGKKQQDFMALLIGLIMYAILKYIPYISGLATFFATVTGMGAWYLVLRNKEVKVSKIKRSKASK